MIYPSNPCSIPIISNMILPYHNFKTPLYSFPVAVVTSYKTLQAFLTLLFGGQKYETVLTGLKTSVGRTMNLFGHSQEDSVFVSFPASRAAQITWVRHSVPSSNLTTASRTSSHRQTQTLTLLLPLPHLKEAVIILGPPV